jgi:hypothetical protein
VLRLDLPGYPPRDVSAAPGDSLIAEPRADGLHLRHTSEDGRVKEEVVLPPSPALRQRQAALDAILAGVRLAPPRAADSHPVMKQVYRRD